MGILDGTVAVITGAGSGMGKASTRTFVREGARVVAADISGAEAQTAAEVGPEVVPCHCDVSQEADIERLIAVAEERFGRIDAMLNVAGIGGAEPLDDLAMTDFDRKLDVNLRGVLLGTKHAIRSMMKSGGGAIVNWGSVAALNASAAYPSSAYSVSKAGVVALTKAAAVEYGRYGIRANVICPGFILSEIMGRSAAQRFPDLVNSVAALERMGQPDEVAEVAAFLASSKASFVSGAVLPVDGGWAAKLA
jgi:NAD(P)-dependent dehydrogenase (short-subunit alcohol dehydrogenase family)